MQRPQFGNIAVDRVVEAEGLGFAPGFLLPGSDIDAICETTGKHPAWTVCARR